MTTKKDQLQEIVETLGLLLTNQKEFFENQNKFTYERLEHHKEKIIKDNKEITKRFNLSQLLILQALIYNERNIYRLERIVFLLLA